MNTSSFATNPLVSARARTASKPTYLNSRAGASHQEYGSSIAQLEEMMTISPVADLPVTSTLRLLEVSCGLTHEQVERLLAPVAQPAAPIVSEKVTQTTFYQRAGAMVWTFFLTGCVAAFLIALS